MDLCEMLVRMKHPDVKHLSREEMRRRAAHLPEQGVPAFVTRILEQGDEDLPNKSLYAEKNATPAEPPASGERALRAPLGRSKIRCMCKLTPLAKLPFCMFRLAKP